MVPVRSAMLELSIVLVNSLVLVVTAGHIVSVVSVVLIVLVASIVLVISGGSRIFAGEGPPAKKRAPVKNRAASNDVGRHRIRCGRFLLLLRFTRHVNHIPMVMHIGVDFFNRLGVPSAHYRAQR